VTDTTARPLALIVALAVERRTLQSLLSRRHESRVEDRRVVQGYRADQPVILIQAGLGSDNARAAARLVCRHFDCRALWSVGVAGGLAPTLRPGQLVVPSAVFPETPGRVLPVTDSGGLKQLEPHVARGRLLTLSRPLLTAGEKQAWHERTGAIAVDMEAAGVGEAAAELGLPWCAVKAILDSADQTLPAFLAAGTSAEGDLTWSPLLSALWSPARLRAALGLGRATRVALAALVAALAALLDAGSP